ncbi:MAG TPA: ferrochelatase [Mycobacteriales bacterium]|nr:ferrochelatase [Mycobacteriales bacterium]
MSVGVLVMSYGTPRDRSDIGAYYTDIRRGKPPPEHLLADLVRRYDAIGGTFPLRSLTEAQGASLRKALDELGEFAVTLGCKHSAPRIADGMRVLAERRVDRVIGLVLAPHYSRRSIGEYAAQAAAAAAEFGLAVQVIESWHLLGDYLDFLTAAVRDALAGMPAGSEVVFTAHSLPQRILATGDPYPEQLRETAAAVATAAGLARWSVGWQSAGRTPEPWLGPDVLDVVRDRAGAGVPGLVVCACGFVADHLEVAYDLDIEAARLAAEVGLPFARTRSVNDDPAVCAALARLVAER